MPLLLYKCPKCESNYELFDDESKICKKTDCGETVEVVTEGNVTAAATTELYSNRHTYYDSMPDRHEWNKSDMKRLAAEQAAKQFQEGLKKL